MVIRTVAPLVIMASVVLAGLAPKTATAQIPDPLVSIVDIVVESLEVLDGELVANALVTLNVVGEEITRAVQIPLDLNDILNEQGECDILRLELGPLELDLLGLVVELDDCNDGPVIVDIDAMTGDGLLLGNLLCGLLGRGLDLGDILDLGLLNAADQQLVTDELVDLLNGLLAGLLASGDASTAQHGGGNRRCDILNLELGPLMVNLLGLDVETSPICLDVYAERGGGLLGNLLCGVAHLLDNPGNNLGGQLAHLRRIIRLLDSL